MDPNATLRALREAWAKANAQDDSLIGDAARLEALAEAAEAADSLDEWLSKGGSFPEAWLHGSDDQGRSFHRRTNLLLQAPLPPSPSVIFSLRPASGL